MHSHSNQKSHLLYWTHVTDAMGLKLQSSNTRAVRPYCVTSLYGKHFRSKAEMHYSPSWVLSLDPVVRPPPFLRDDAVVFPLLAEGPGKAWATNNTGAAMLAAATGDPGWDGDD